MTVDDACPQALGIALHVRDAAGLPTLTEPAVPALDALFAAPDPPGGDLVAAGGQWGRWWESLLDGEQGLGGMVPPGFAGLTSWPDLRAVVTALFEPAVRWTGHRRTTFIAAFAENGAPVGIEGDVVRSVERDLGRRAAPFRLRITVLPVSGAWWAARGPSHLLVSEQFRADTLAYGSVLRPVVATLAEGSD